MAVTHGIVTTTGDSSLARRSMVFFDLGGSVRASVVAFRQRAREAREQLVQLRRILVAGEQLTLLGGFVGQAVFYGCERARGWYGGHTLWGS